MDEKKEKGTVLSGPNRKELVDSRSNATPVTFTADNESGVLNVIVSEFTDMRLPNVDRWQLNAITVQGGKSLNIYYTFPQKRGLYLFT